MQGTEDRIRAAALAEFVTNGYAATSMARIRSHAAVSNGSLFHFFPRKADLAAGVLVEGMRDCQDAVLAALDTTAEHGVRGGVRALLAWGQQARRDGTVRIHRCPRRRLARCRAHARGTQPTLRAPHRDLAERSGFAARQTRPFEVVHALWFGPSMELCRHWVRGRSRITPTNAAEELSAAAWRAVDGR